MANTEAHPTPAMIEAFAAGRLGWAEMDQVEAHLVRCPSCGQRLRAVPDDRVTLLLRRPAPKPADRSGPV